MDNRKARLIAYYLPQFHPIPENDTWWGKGFTEWTNVGKAKPLFKGHYQPRVPADLGYYDLRIPEVRELQVELAKEAGIEGFCYWHYWFGGGRRLLEKPINEVLASGKPDFPFCFGWANETWSGIWHGLGKKVLIEQTYPGKEDNEAHFYDVLPAFQDKRYIRIDNKPVFQIYQPLKLKDAQEFMDLWNALALKNGLDGIYFIAHSNDSLEYDNLINLGFDGVNIVRTGEIMRHERSFFDKVLNKLRSDNSLKVFEYSNAIKYFLCQEMKKENCFPTIIPNWDHSPRSGKKGLILHGSTPELFRKHVTEALDLVTGKEFDKKVIFVKSWNEWAEGNYLEPDLQFGHGYLNVLRDLVLKK